MYLDDCEFVMTRHTHNRHHYNHHLSLYLLGGGKKSSFLVEGKSHGILLLLICAKDWYRQKVACGREAPIGFVASDHNVIRAGVSFAK